MIDAGDGRRVHDVVDDLVERRRGASEGVEPLQVRIPVDAVIGHFLRAAGAVGVILRLLRFHDHLRHVVADEGREEVDHADAAILRQGAEHVVGHVAGMAAERAAGRMRRHDRHARRLDHLLERGVGDVRDVDDHAEVVHRVYDLAAEAGQAVVPRLVARRVAPVVRVHVRQRHVARAALVEVAERVERVLDGVAALDADHERDLRLLLRRSDAGDVGREGDLSGVSLDLAVNQVDQPVRERRRAAPGVVRRDVCGEERRGDAALLERFQVELGLGVVICEPDVVAVQAIRRVAVSVDDDGPAVNVVH